MYQVYVEDNPELALPVGTRPRVIGRAPSCDLVLADAAVSGRHVAVWSDGEAVWVQDLASRNGALLNGVAVTGLARAGAGDRLTVGVTVLVLDRREGAAPEPGRLLLVEDLASGQATRFDGERLRLGDGPGAHLRVAGADEVVLLRVGPDEVLLGAEDDTRPLRVGEPFAVGGRDFVLRWAEGTWGATRDLGAPGVGYRLEVTLEGGPGPLAVVSHPSGASLRVAAENRATLLWVLARRRRDDEEAELPEESRGWVPEQEALTAVWGRGAGGSSTNLRVLVCRMRKDLREAGLDPWLLEHRAGHLRARVADIVIR